MEYNHPLLAICIPSYNGGEILCNIVKKVLQFKDDRFVIHVSDNASNDDTRNKLEEIASEDKRLIVTENENNVPSYVNYNYALSRVDAEYVYFIIDKELVNTDCLKGYLDFLENEKPAFGYVKAKDNCEGQFTIYPKGLESIKYISYFGNTHPTGFFFNRNLYLKENDNVLKITEGGSLWLPDYVALCLGFEYNGVHYFSSLNKFNYLAVLGGFSKSQGKLENIYFYGGKRCDDFRSVVKLILFKDSSKGAKPILNAASLRYIELVTYFQRLYFKDEQRCMHYGVEARDVSYSEMIHWCKVLWGILIAESKEHGLSVSSMSFNYYVMRSLFKAFVYGSPYVEKKVRRFLSFFRKN